ELGARENFDLDTAIGTFLAHLLELESVEVLHVALGNDAILQCKFGGRGGQRRRGGQCRGRKIYAREAISRIHGDPPLAWRAIFSHAFAKSRDPRCFKLSLSRAAKSIE